MYGVLTKLVCCYWCLACSGTVRANLDPFGNYSDEAIWNALRDVSLENVVQQMGDGLYSSISEGGGNLSVGQRQLVCLARAILKSKKIILLDEATANVDNDTDNLIQDCIRTKFNDRTVLVIAHRLNTIMGSDRVMLMDAGRIVEFDTPGNLLADSGSMFSQLVATASATAAREPQGTAADLM